MKTRREETPTEKACAALGLLLALLLCIAVATIN